MGDRGSDPADEIEDEVAGRSKMILNIVAKQPQKPDIAKQVHPPAVHEHREDHGHSFRFVWEQG